MSSSQARAEAIESGRCRVAVRRAAGPLATEVFIAAEPLGGADDQGEGRADDPAAQAAAIYEAALDVLEGEGAGFASVFAETIHLRDPGETLEAMRDARGRVLTARGAVAHRPACLAIEQPPLAAGAALAVELQAVVPHAGPLQVEVVEPEARGCACAECARAHALCAHVGDEVRLHAAGLGGVGDDVQAETVAAFEAAEALLQRAGMDFGHVVRTWIHLRDIDRDYADFNRGRRAFFASRGIGPPPASTGIGGGPVSDAHRLCLGLIAVRSPVPATCSVMTSPTLNEAPDYGADFTRGMKVVEANRVALHVSGTASIDEAGRTAHPGDLDAQADRMRVNIEALLEAQGAGLGDVVSAVTYVKHAADAERLRARLEAVGFTGFPHVWVEAAVCRPELLCETEVLAILPRERGGA